MAKVNLLFLNQNNVFQQVSVDFTFFGATVNYNEKRFL
jgi:hypothetical protein